MQGVALRLVCMPSAADMATAVHTLQGLLHAAAPSAHQPGLPLCRLLGAWHGNREPRPTSLHCRTSCPQPTARRVCWRC